MPAAVERIVVQVPPAEKKTLVAKARRFEISLSELMRRGASAYAAAPEEKELEALLERVKVSTKEAEAALDGALAFVTASNKRLAKLQGR